MGHYCYKCDEKICGGVVPTTCKCIECYCETCWRELFQYQYVNENNIYYIKENEDFKKVDYDLFILKKNDDVKCPKCKNNYKIEEIDDY